MKVSDMTRAMCRPEYRSRTTERTTVMLAAADAVHEAPRRAASRKLLASPQESAATT